MAWVLFNMRGRIGAPVATINKHGLISFNLAAIIAYNIKSTYALLYRDKVTNRIGVQPGGKQDGAGKLTVKSNSAFISCRRFLVFCGIDHSETRRYPVTWDDEQGMLVIQL